MVSGPRGRELALKGTNMRDGVPLELLAQLRSLLAVAGRDESAALVGFEALRARYPSAEVGAAVVAVTAEFLGGPPCERRR